ncbi:MAG TPA: YbhN family protein [Gemmatimonadaceae bacterium]|nr:YbhN family protein [Gemmatimonadaceae bacterium]
MAEKEHKHRWILRAIVLVALVAGMATLAPKLASLRDVGRIVHDLRWSLLAAAVAAQIASYLAHGYTIYSVAELAGDHIPYGRSAMIGIAAGSVGLLAGGPVGDATAIIHWVKRAGGTPEGAVLCGWLPALLNAAALIVLALLGLVILLMRHLLSHSELAKVAMLSLPVLVFVAGIAWVMATEKNLRRFVHFVQGMKARVMRHPPDPRELDERVSGIANARRLLFRHGGWRGPVAGTMANAAFDIVTLQSLFLAAGSHPKFAVLIAGYGLPQVLARTAVFVPSGVGLVEGGMVGLYKALGEHTATAVLVVLAYRVLSFWAPTLIGAPVAVVLQRSTRKREQTERVLKSRSTSV